MRGDDSQKSCVESSRERQRCVRSLSKQMCINHAFSIGIWLPTPASAIFIFFNQLLASKSSERLNNMANFKGKLWDGVWSSFDWSHDSNSLAFHSRCVCSICTDKFRAGSEKKLPKQPTASSFVFSLRLPFLAPENNISKSPFDCVVAQRSGAA